MKITKRQLRRIIREEKAKILKEAYGQSAFRYGRTPPRGKNAVPKDSSWYDFAKELDMGILELDDFAYDMGFSNFMDMDISIGPKALADRDPSMFATKVAEISMFAADLSPTQILSIAGSKHVGHMEDTMRDNQ